MAQPYPNRTKALAIIAGVVVIIVLLFAFAAGWLTPGRISGDTMIDTLQQNNTRIYRGFRRAHAKGICVAGQFDANGAGTAWSSAALFPKASIPFVGRFSTDSGDPDSKDADALFHALGLYFKLPDGEEWRMAMDHTPEFVASNARDVDGLFAVTTPEPKTGKPDGAKVAAFMASHPEVTKAITSAPMPSSFANGTYYSISAFRFIDAQGRVRMVRWQFEPVDPFTALDPKTKASLPNNFLFDGLLERAKRGPIRWRLLLVEANPGDVTNNSTVAWTGPHQQIEVGTLVMDRVALEESGGCNNYNYDPTILPHGVAISDDPLLAARAAAYSVDFRRREIEGPHPDAITRQRLAEKKEEESHEP